MSLTLITQAHMSKNRVVMDKVKIINAWAWTRICLPACKTNYQIYHALNNKSQHSRKPKAFPLMNNKTMDIACMSHLQRRWIMPEENTKIINPDPTPLLLNKSDPKTNAFSSLTSVHSPQHSLSFFLLFVCQNFLLKLPRHKEILSFSSFAFDRNWSQALKPFSFLWTPPRNGRPPLSISLKPFIAEIMT